jgi:hypothetical protein
VAVNFQDFFKVRMKVLKFLLVLAIVSRSSGSSIEDSIETLEHLFVNFNFPLTINAFLCWETGKFQIIRNILDSFKISYQITQLNLRKFSTNETLWLPFRIQTLSRNSQFISTIISLCLNLHVKMRNNCSIG